MNSFHILHVIFSFILVIVFSHENVLLFKEKLHIDYLKKYKPKLNQLVQNSH